ncbi:MAG TPA: 30S ribosomal protein S4 [Candidatus Melainabacteria bacterium]|nr:30S ribosomal protein S4 [Candidatus Melainabacteria bacterium]
MRYTGPKAKRCRAMGINLYGNQKFDRMHKPYPPGQHGQARKKKSDYADHLMEKQKIKWSYGCTERQLVKIYDEAAKTKTNTGLLILQILERRLDNVVFKSGLFASRNQTRQLVAHGHVLVNGKKALSPSIRVKVGDKITFKQKSKKFVQTLTSEWKNISQNWLSVDKDNLAIEVLSIPTRDQIDQTFKEQFLVEYYSH